MANPKQKISGQSLHEFVQSQIERLACRFTHLKWDEPATSKEYKRILRGMVEVYGQPRTEAAITRAIDSPGFLEPDVLRKNIPPATDGPTRCDSCRENEGWIFVLVDGETSHRLLRCKHQDGLVSIQVQIPDKFRPWEQQTVDATVLASPIHPDPPIPLPRHHDSPFKAKIPTLAELAMQTARLKEQLSRAKRMP